jgi:hypothetical protein
MPIVVKQDSKDSKDSDLRVVALMLNIEAGADVYHVSGGRVATRPPPHAPWPLVEVPPVTADGRPWHVHYRASAGVVYHTAVDAREEAAVYERLAALLAAADAGHLAAPRAAFGTTTAVVRLDWHGPEAAGVTNQAVLARRDGRRALAQRAFVRANRPAAVSHVSKSGPFTWYFAPVSIAVSLSGGSMTPPAVNALVASVIYDLGGHCAWADGAAPLSVCAADVRHAHWRSAPGDALGTAASAIQVAARATAKHIATWLTPRAAAADFSDVDDDGDDGDVDDDDDDDDSDDA